MPMHHLVRSWGYRGVEQAVTVFNRPLEDPEMLEPSRRTHRQALPTPPFFAMEIEPAITNTGGELRIDTSVRVLAENGLPISRPLGQIRGVLIMKVIPAALRSRVCSASKPGGSSQRLPKRETANPWRLSAARYYERMP